MFLASQFDQINTATKYPSILTYHVLGERGVLTEETSELFGDDYYVTEKINGANSRLIIDADYDWIVGSREDIFWANNDRSFNPSQSIVKTIRKTISDLSGTNFADFLPEFLSGDNFIVVYGEVYGDKTINNDFKQYGDGKNTGFRIFDVATFSKEIVFNQKVEQLAIWRERNNSFFSKDLFNAFAFRSGFQSAPRLPIKSSLPKSIQDTYNWMKEIGEHTKVSLLDGHIGKAEGFIVRSEDRKKIVKIRFEDYERTFRKWENDAHQKVKQSSNLTT